ncbi:MAG: adenosylcobinamide-GDP ribazoletransferase, partial [Lachnospiraceae bacterium]|nr:adenosylcobinamide-GDP ribazoletransferase [Lachnospiraceae bacterium]
MKTEQHCNVAKVVAIAFSMYSKIPMPQFSWEEEERRYAMAAFPLVGLLIDLLEAILFFCGKKIGLPALPLSILLLLLPVLVDGGI